MQNVEKQAPILSKLVRSLCNVQKTDLSDSTKYQTKRVLLDTLGAGICGSKKMLSHLGIKATSEEYGAGECLLWGSKKSLCATGATFLSALAISATDFDEGHRAAAGHPVGVVVPTALALGKETQETMDKVLSAIIVGYEIGTRFRLIHSAEL